MGRTLVISLFAFTLNACAPATPVIAPPALSAISTAVSSVVSSAAGAAPGLYPGRAENVDEPYERAEYDLYISHAQPKAIEVERRIAAIKRRELQPGCIGRDVYTCMATLAQTLAVTTSYQRGALDIEGKHQTADPLIAHDKTDINGRTIFSRELRFTAFVPGLDAGTVLPTLHAIDIYVMLRDDRTVKKMSIILRGNPLSAKTLAEYDATGVYEVIAAVSTPTCSNLRRLDVYKMIENHLKRKLNPTHDFEASMNDVSETRGREGVIKFCGRNLMFYSFSGHAVSAVSQINDTGIIGGATLSIE